MLISSVTIWYAMLLEVAIILKFEFSLLEKAGGTDSKENISPETVLKKKHYF